MKRHLLACGSLLLIALLNFPLHAQNESTSHEEKLEKMVVLESIDGRKLEVTLLSKSVRSVQVRRSSDDKVFGIPLKKLSKESQVLVSESAIPEGDEKNILKNSQAKASKKAPAHSSISVVVTESIKQPDKKDLLLKEDVGNKCYAGKHSYRFEPKFVRGVDADDSELVINFYTMKTYDYNDRKTKTRKVFTRPFTVEPQVYTHRDTIWGCRCCKDMNVRKLEWYVEVMKGDVLLCSDQSSSSSKMKKMIKDLHSKRDSYDSK